jgi:ATP-dependent Clp protease ATP-binding subunit ClpA
MSRFKSFLKAVSTPQATTDVLSNLTPRASQALELARQEAERFNHNFVGTEHLLLGIIALGQGVAVNVLLHIGLDLDKVRTEVEKQIGKGPDQIVHGIIPFTPRVKKVLHLAANEAKSLNHTYVGTEHILLGLLREGDGVAAPVLKNLGVEIEQTRLEILKELDPNFSAESQSTMPPEPTGEPEPKPQVDLIDTSKRYDVYCTERNNEVVVYRNALFKGRKKLFPMDREALFSEFLELEQPDGQTVFVARACVIKFCEPGVKPGAEPV